MKTFSIRSLFMLVALVASGLFLWLPTTVTVRVDDEFIYGFCNVSEGEKVYAVGYTKNGPKHWIAANYLRQEEGSRLVSLRVSRLNSFRFSTSRIYDFSFEPPSSLGCIWHFPDEIEN